MANRVGLLMIGAVTAAVTGCQVLSLGGIRAVEMPGPTRKVLHTSTGAGVQPMPAEGLGLRLLPTGATANTAENNHAAGLTIDANQGSYWASGPQASEATLTLAFSSSQSFRWALIKTGPMPAGVTFKFMVSDDGTSWNPASPRQMNSTWEMQLQDIYGEGKFLQVRFFNRDGGPPNRFKIHEIEVYSGAEIKSHKGG
jgi:hypothetical protein